MAHEKLRILNLTDVADAHAMANAPRSLQAFNYTTHPCGDCPGHCCRVASVPITTVEALRISFKHLLAVEQVVQLVETPDGQGVTLGSVPIPLHGGVVTLRLRHAVEGGCTFLHTTAAQGRCSIHANRPGSCALFPLEVQVGPDRVAVGDASLCPSRWLKDEALEKEATRAWKQWRADLAAEVKLVRAWLQVGGATRGAAEFLAFASAYCVRVLRWKVPTVVTSPGRRLGKRLW